MLERRVLAQPLLYVSAFLERNRDDYYNTLMRGRTHGDVLPWIRLFLRAVELQAIEATRRADQVSALRESYQDRFSKSKSTIIRPLLDALFQSLAVTVPAVAKRFRVTYPTAQSAVEELVTEGILRETTGQRRSRAYLAHEIVALVMPEESRATSPVRAGE